MDYRYYSSRALAARLFRWENQSKIPENWWLDPHSNRYRCYTRYIEPSSHYLNLLSRNDLTEFI